MRAIKILLVDDHKMFREGVISIIQGNPDFEVIGQAGNGKEALEFIKASSEPPKVVLMDINMPVMDGLACTTHLLKEHPGVNVIILTMVKQDVHIKRMLKAGAMGYILKSSDRNELFHAIKQVSKDEPYFSPSVSNEVMQQMMQLKKRPVDYGEILTTREKEVLDLIVKDLSNHEIACKLKVSIRTVESHKQNLLSKTCTNNVAGLVVFAIKNSLIEL